MSFFHLLFLILAPTCSLASSMRGLSATPFFWGVANASFQVEGSPVDSDWYRFTHTKGMIKDGTNADRGTDFWNRYAEDFALAKKLGANSFRISVAWERIQPKANEWDENALRHYEIMIAEMRRLGLEPIVTLQHFVLPAWLSDDGGLRSSQFPALFTEYSKKVISRLMKGPASVKYWMTFNEPEILVLCGYVWGCWPPKHHLSVNQAVEAEAGIARAHLSVVNWVRHQGYSQLKMSVAKHWSVMQAKTNNNADLNATKMFDYIFNRQFMDAFVYGKLHFSMPLSKKINETIPIEGSGKGLDFVSINYYQRSIVSRMVLPPFYKSEKGPGVQNDMGWEIYPDGHRIALESVKQYGFPILISENGIADHDDHLRGKFLQDHIQALNQAKQEGIPLMGYLHWSLTDNFEWADGLTPRFGLVEIDYQTFERHPRPSFEIYRQLIATQKKNFEKPVHP